MQHTRLAQIISLKSLRGYIMTSESLSNVLLDLPAGVLRQVIDCISARDTVSLICTCKQLRDVASEDVVWEPKFLKWHYRSARWQTDERPWLSKYGARKEVIHPFPLTVNDLCPRAWSRASAWGQ